MRALSDTQKRLLARIDRGAKLACELTEEGPRYFLVCGRTVPAPTARTLIDNGLVVPSGDGMFGATQTWVRAQNVAA